MSDSAWRELSAAEAKVAQPFTLDCEGLSAQARDEVRSRYVQIAARSLRLTVDALGRVPSSGEIDTLRTAVTRYFNSHVIPPLRGAGSLH